MYWKPLDPNVIFLLQAMTINKKKLLINLTLEYPFILFNICTTACYVVQTSIPNVLPLSRLSSLKWMNLDKYWIFLCSC